MGIRRYAINTAWLMAEKVIRLAIGLVVSVWVIRYLGPEEYGALSYAQNFVSLFTVIATLGLDGVIVKDLISNPLQEDEIMGTAFYLRMTGAIVMLIVIFFGTLVLGENDANRMLIIAIAASQFLLTFSVINFYFQSIVVAKYIAVTNLIAVTGSSLIKILLIIAKAPLLAFGAVAFVDSVLVTIGYIYFYKKIDKKLLKWRFNGKIARRLVIQSWPLAVSFMFAAITLRIDQVIIKQFLGVEAVGYYAASLRLVEVFYFIPVAVTTSLFPKLVELSKGDAYRESVLVLGSLLTYSALFLGILFALSADVLVQYVFGSKYSVTSEILIFHALSMVFVFQFSLRKKLLIAEDASMFVLCYSAATSMLMVILLFTLVYFMGVMGAGIAYLGAWALSLLLVPVVLGRTNETIIFIKSFNPIYIVRFLQKHKVI